MLFIVDERCKSCLFLRLCRAADLPHCEGEFVIDRGDESGVVQKYGHENAEDHTGT